MMKNRFAVICAVAASFIVCSVFAAPLFSQEQGEKSLMAIQKERKYLTGGEKDKIEAEQKKLDKIEAKKKVSTPTAAEAKLEAQAQADTINHLLVNPPKKVVKKQWYEAPWFDFRKDDPRQKKIQALNKLASSAWKEKKYEEARGYYNDLMVLDPDHSTLYIHQMKHVDNSEKAENKKGAKKYPSLMWPFKARLI